MSKYEKIFEYIDEGADFNLIKAILTFYARSERFCSGAWAAALDDKIFYRIIKRLKLLQGGCSL